MRVMLIGFMFVFGLITYTQVPLLPGTTENGNFYSGSTRGVTLIDSLPGVLPGSTAINSQNYLDPPLAGYYNAAADDFTVPACETWQITTVEVAGNYSDPLMVGQLGPAVFMNVYILEDDGTGQPDTVNLASALYSFPSLNYTDYGNADLSIDLPTPASISGGSNGATFWVVIQADLAVLSGGQWSWSESTVNVGSNNFMWMQERAGPLGGINGCVQTWENGASCLVAGPLANLGFRLEGSVQHLFDIQVDPGGLGLGLIPPFFDIIPDCETLPYSQVDWVTVPSTPMIPAGEGVVLSPPPTVSTVVTVTVTDGASNVAIDSCILLVPLFSDFIDYNGDGCNNFHDLWDVFQIWTEVFPGDPNGDGIINVLDFLYINTTDPTPCP